MTERWVINASPLILLGKAGQLDWVARLGEVVIPKAVADEIAAGGETDPSRVWICSPIGSALVKDDVPAKQEVVCWDLGEGETAVLAWAIAAPDYEAILDDAAARRCAVVFGVKLRGTLSLVALAKKRGLIAECRPVFARLQEAGLYVRQDLVEQVAASAGE